MVVRVQLQAVGRGALAEDVPAVCCGLPVGEVRAAGGVVARADVAESEDVGDLARRVELGERGVGDLTRNAAVVALGFEPVVVEPLAQLLCAGDRVDVAALGVRVLVVSGELDLLVADPRELLEDLLEPRRQVGRVRVAADGVPHRVEDDAALAGRHQHAVAVGLGGGRTGRHARMGVRTAAAEADDRGCGEARGGRQKLPPAETEPAPEDAGVLLGLVGQIIHDAPLHGSFELMVDFARRGVPAPAIGRRLDVGGAPILL